MPHVIADVDMLTVTDDWKINAVDDSIPVEEDSAAQMVDDYWSKVLEKKLSAQVLFRWNCLQGMLRLITWKL